MEDDLTSIAQQTQPKPYWQVLDDYGRASADYPELSKLSVSDFSHKMNEVTGTNQYDEGTKDNWIRRLGVAPERVLRHFGGEVPGSKILSAVSGASATAPLGPIAPLVGMQTATGVVPTPSELLGGPKEGIDVIGGAGTLAEKAARGLGASEDIAQGARTGAEGFVKTIPTIGATIAFPEAAIPILAGGAGLETYGETGKAGPATASAIGAGLIPKFMQKGGQFALKLAGAKTLGEVAPGAANLLEKGTAATAAQLGTLVPSGLVQRAAEFGGKQIGLTANMFGTGTAQIAVDPTLSWQDKLKQMGGQFSPSNLTSTAIGQLPFTFMDLIHARTHPANIELRNIRAGFADRFAKAYQADTGVPPTEKEVQSTIDRLETGKTISPDTTTGKVLASLGNIPIGMEKRSDYKTSEGDWNPVEAIETTREKANRMLFAQGLTSPDKPAFTSAHDPIIATVLDSIDNPKALDKDTFAHLAAKKVSDMWANNRTDLLKSGGVPDAEGFIDESPRFGRGAYSAKEGYAKRFASYQEQASIEEKIAMLVDPESKYYDQETAQKMALVAGDPEHWLKAGIPEELFQQIRGAVDRGAAGEAPEDAEQPPGQRLLTNIINRVSGLGPKRFQRVQAIEKQIQEEIAQHGIFAEEFGGRGRLEELARQLKEAEGALKWERSGLQTSTRKGSEKNVGAPLGDSTFAARRAALEYPHEFDIKDPAKVAQFVNYIAKTIKNAEKEYARQRTGSPTVKGADGRTLRFPKEALAKEHADHLNSLRTGQEQFNVLYTVPDSAEPDGMWVVHENTFASVFGHPAPEAERTAQAGLRSFEERMAEVEPEETTEKPLVEEQGVPEGATMQDLSRDLYKEHFDKLDKINDPAVREGRKAALAKNFSDMMQIIPDAKFREIWKAGLGKRVQDVDFWKKRFISYVQFLALDGDVSISQDGNRLKGVGNLNRLNQFMGPLGHGKYDAKHKRAGEERSDLFNNRSLFGGTNFFEKFAILSQHISRFLVNPKTMLPDPEYRPPGDYGWQTPEFRRDFEKKVVGMSDPKTEPLNWPEHTKADPKKIVYFQPGILNRDGSPFRSDLAGIGKEPGTIKNVSGHPLADMITQMTKHDLVMNARDVAKWFKQLGGVDTSLAEELFRRLPFVANQKVGFSITKDPLNRGYFHTNDLSSAGVLVDPYLFTKNYRFELQQPHEIFQTLMEELGHSSVDFAYNTDAAFKTEVDRVYSYVKDRLDGLISVGAASEDKLAQYVQVQLTSMRNPQEMLAGMFKDPGLHEYLNSIDDPEPLTPHTYPQLRRSMFDRLYNLIKDLFKKLIGEVGANKMLARVASLTSRAVEIQQGMRLTNRGDIFQFLYDKGLLELPKPGGAPDIMRTVTPKPVPKAVEPTQVYPAWTPKDISPPKPGPTGEPDPKATYLWEGVLTAQKKLQETDWTKEGIAAKQDALSNLNTLKELYRQYTSGQSEGIEPPAGWKPTFAPKPYKFEEPGTLPTDLQPVQAMLEDDVRAASARLALAQSQGEPSPGGVTRPGEGVPFAEQRLQDARERLAKYERGELSAPELVTPTAIRDLESKLADLQAQLYATNNLHVYATNEVEVQQRLTSERLQGEITALSKLIPHLKELAKLKEGQRMTNLGQVLESRLGLLMPIQGNKARAVEDQRVRDVFERFAKNVRVVYDAFPGSGKVTEIMKDLGVKWTVLNSKDPDYLALWHELKNNTADFARRVAKAAEPIEAPRIGKPTIPGGDINEYLARLEMSDPPVGLLLRQQFTPLGKEVRPATAVAQNVTKTGLEQLPGIIQNLAPKIDKIVSKDGWAVARGLKPGQGGVLDPPYVDSMNMYRIGKSTITAEERLKDYEENVIPSAQRGAKFMIFDKAKPALMDYLTRNGFEVVEFQRSQKGRTLPDPEFVATNTPGSVLESRVEPSRVIDAMKAASVGLFEDPDGNLWFKPYSAKYFRDSFGPALGNKLRLTENKGVWGYSVRPSDAFNLTEADVDRMPVPRPKSWAPSAYETMKSLFKQQGASDDVAEAQAAYNLRYASLLKNTENVLWGVLPTAKDPNEVSLGTAWGYEKHVGLHPESTGLFTPMETTLRHEGVHVAGFHPWYKREPRDVRMAMHEVNTLFGQLTEDQRRTLMTDLVNTTNYDFDAHGTLYEAAITDPTEFAAEVMSHVGDVITQVPDPSVYMLDMMRFAPDEVSRMLQVATLRRTQALDALRYMLDNGLYTRGVKNSISDVLNGVIDVFKGMSRSALEIAEDTSEFYRTRMVYPDVYKGLLNQYMERQAEFATLTEKPTPKLEGHLLESRMPPIIENLVRMFIPIPTSDGHLPTKLSLWDKNLMQMHQFALKYPIARSFVDMFEKHRSSREQFRLKGQVALAGSWEGNTVMDDVRTKHVADFYKSPTMRAKLSQMALEADVVGDNRYDREKEAAGGNEFAMDPTKVAFITPEYLRKLMDKHGVTDAERPIIQTVWDGLRNQYAYVGNTIVSAHVHEMTTMLAMGISRNTELEPEGARAVAQSLVDSIDKLPTDPQAAAAARAEFDTKVSDPDVRARLVDFAQRSFRDIERLRRSIDMRSPYYFSEMRPGKYGLVWQDEKGKPQNRYFLSAKERDKYVTANNIKPVRQTNPDSGIGINPNIMGMIDEIHKQTVARMTNLFGQEEAERLGRLTDFSTELRDALNRNDLLKETLGRKLQPGRDELDMFDTTQHYLNSVANAIGKRFIKREAELLFTSPAFDNEPEIKAHIQGHIEAFMKPDTPVGSFLRNLGFFHYLWGNVSSMIMQTSHQVMGLAPMLTRMGQTVSGSFDMIRKANLAVIEARRRGGYKDPVVDEMVKRLHEDVGASSWISRETNYNRDLSLINRIRGTSGKPLWEPFDMLKNRLFQGFDLVRRLYDIVPTYNSEVAFVAAVMHLKSARGGGLTGEHLYKEALFLRGNTMYTGGKENRPGFFQWMPRSAAQGLWSLQTYANGLTTELGELIRRSFNPAGMTPAQTKQVRKAAAQMLITQTAIAGVFGLPFTTLIMTGLQALFKDHNLEKDLRDMFANLAGDDDAMGSFLSNAAIMGIPSAMDYSPDLGSRFALHGVFHVSPYGDVGWEQLAGPAGGVMSNVLKASQAGLEGKPMQTVQSLMPVGFRRIWQGIEQGQTYKTQSGRIIVDDLGPTEVVARMIGFRPARVRRIEDVERLNKVSMDAEQEAQQSWTKQQVNLLQENRDTEVRQNLAKRVAETKGLRSMRQLGEDVSKEYERNATPLDLRRFGNRATVQAQRTLQGALGRQTEGPSNTERLQLQAQIATRLGLTGPSRARWRHASRLDQLLQMYPHLTTPQASLLLDHAAATRPTPELYRELLGTGE